MPTTVSVNGTLVHDPNTNPVKKVKLYVDSVFESEQSLPLNIGTTFNFALPWNITTAGSHTLVVTAKHGNCGANCIGVDEEVLTVINLGDGGGDGGGVNCPAAPAIAAGFMLSGTNSNPVKPGSATWKSIMTAVAKQTGSSGTFWAKYACGGGNGYTTAADYVNAVKDYVNAHD